MVVKNPDSAVNQVYSFIFESKRLKTDMCHKISKIKIKQILVYGKKYLDASQSQNQTLINLKITAMKTTIFLIMMFTGIFISPVTTPTPDSISGFVKDATSGNVIENATVSLYRDGNFVSSVKTGTSGAFFFSKLTPAKYLIKATKTGFDKWTGIAFELKKGEFKSVSVSLSPVVEVVVDELQQEQVMDKKNYSVGAAMKTKCSESQAYFASPVAYDMVEVEHNTEEYDKINENAFKESLTNPLSTFSADVDKASYSNVRRFLNQNQMPYKDVVRVEEMINYFEYNYPQPTNGDPHLSPHWQLRGV
jgi:Ca-activated chloride channel family protein